MTASRCCQRVSNPTIAQAQLEYLLVFAVLLAVIIAVYEAKGGIGERIANRLQSTLNSVNGMIDVPQE